MAAGSDAGVRRGAKFFLGLAGVLALLGVSGCAVAIAMFNSSPGGGYEGIGVGVAGLFALIGAGVALVVAGILFLVAHLMDRR